MKKILFILLGIVFSTQTMNNHNVIQPSLQSICSRIPDIVLNIIHQTKSMEDQLKIIDCLKLVSKDFKKTIDKKTITYKQNLFSKPKLKMIIIALFVMYKGKKNKMFIKTNTRSLPNISDTVSLTSIDDYPLCIFKKTPWFGWLPWKDKERTIKLEVIYFTDLNGLEVKTDIIGDKLNQMIPFSKICDGTTHCLDKGFTVKGYTTTPVLPRNTQYKALEGHLEISTYMFKKIAKHHRFILKKAKLRTPSNKTLENEKK